MAYMLNETKALLCFFQLNNNQSDDPVISWSINYQHYVVIVLVTKILQIEVLTYLHGIILSCWRMLLLRDTGSLSCASHVWVMFISVVDWLTDCSWHLDTLVSTRRLLITQHSHMLTLSVQISSYTLTPLLCAVPILDIIQSQVQITCISPLLSHMYI